MPAVTVSRPTRGKFGRPSKQAASITNFARVSKIQDAAGEAAKKEFSAATELAPLSVKETGVPKKRKAADGHDSPATSETIQKRTRRREPEKDASSRQRKSAPDSIGSENSKEGGLSAAPPSNSLSNHTKPLRQKRRRNSSTDPSSEDQAGALLERLNLQSPPRKRSRQIKPTASPNTTDQLPEELRNLSQLQAAFLKTLSLHYAHNGSNTPVDVRSLCPSIAQTWGRRKVTLDDVQRCIGMLRQEQRGDDDSAGFGSPLVLSDYGRGKICVELDSGVEGNLLNEEQLNTAFEEKLRLLWSSRKESNVRSFIAALPKAAATPRALSNNAWSSRGQRALDEFKKDIAKKDQEKEAKAQAELALKGADGSKLSLLERIRCKEAQQSQAAKPPSPEELQRRAALHRADDVAGVIGMLSMATAAGRARISFTMAAMLIKLKDSLRIPISPEEGACCVRLLAKEVAPQWLKVVTVGGKENVVIQTASQPSKSVIQEKVKSLISA